MNLLICSLSLAIALLWLKITVRQNEQEKKAFWVAENFVLYFSAPMISGLFALGIIFGLKTIAEFPPSLAECGYSALIAIATGWRLYAMSKSTRNVNQQTTQPAGQRIDVNFGTTTHFPENDNNHPKAPPLKKAA